MKMNDLLNLQVGDIITTDKPCAADAFVQIEGRNKFFAAPGQMRGNRAIRVTKITEQLIEQITEKAGEKK
jgi:flagellar motor switch protein FliM